MPNTPVTGSRDGRDVEEGVVPVLPTRRPPAKFDMVIVSWDCAFKDLKTPDLVVDQLWGRRDADFFLLGQIHGRLDFPATLQAVRNLNELAKCTSQRGCW